MHPQTRATQNLCIPHCLPATQKLLSLTTERALNIDLVMWCIYPCASSCTHFRQVQTVNAFKLCGYSKDFNSRKGRNNVFSNQFGISGILEAWITPDELYWAVWFFCLFFCVCFYVLKQVPSFFSCLGKCCHAFLLWSSSIFFCRPRKLHPSAWGSVDSDWIFICGWTVPLRTNALKVLYIMKLKVEAEASHLFWVLSCLLNVVLPAPTVSPLLSAYLDSQLFLPIEQWLNLLNPHL